MFACSGYAGGGRAWEVKLLGTRGAGVRWRQKELLHRCTFPQELVQGCIQAHATGTLAGAVEEDMHVALHPAPAPAIDGPPVAERGRRRAPRAEWGSASLPRLQGKAALQTGSAELAGLALLLALPAILALPMPGGALAGGAAPTRARRAPAAGR